MRPAAAIGLPTPSSPPLGAARQVAVARRDAVARRLGGLPLVEQQQPLEVVQLLVVERVVWLGDVDLLARLRDAGHLVRHAGGVLHVLGVHEVAVRPVGRVEVPADALDPDGTVRERAGDVLAREDQRDRAVADRRDVETLDGPGEHLAREDVVDREVRLAEQRGRVIRPRSACSSPPPSAMSRLSSPYACMYRFISSAKIHSRFGLERPLDDVVEDREERALRVRAARRHLLLGHAQHDVGHPRGDRVPALDRREDAASRRPRTRACRACPMRRRRRRGSRPCGGRRRTRRVRSPRHTASTSVEPDRPRSRAPPSTAIQARAPCRSPAARRTNLVIPAPTTATRLPTRASPRPRPTSWAGRARPARAPTSPRRRGGAPRTRARGRGRSPRGGRPRRALRPLAFTRPGSRSARPIASRCCSCLYANRVVDLGEVDVGGPTPARRYASAAARSAYDARSPARGSRARVRPGSSPTPSTATASRSPARSPAARTTTTHPSRRSARLVGGERVGERDRVVRWRRRWPRAGSIRAHARGCARRPSAHSSTVDPPPRGSSDASRGRRARAGLTPERPVQHRVEREPVDPPERDDIARLRVGLDRDRAGDAARGSASRP